MSRRLRSLLVHLAAALAAALVLMVVLRVAGQILHPWLPLAVLLVVALCAWLLSPDLRTADALETPALDDEPEALSPHAADVTVRRLEEMIHGAGPRRRMTSRALGQVLARAAEEREHRDDAPPLPEDLRSLMRAASAEDGTPVPPVSRTDLRRWLRALAAPEPQHSPIQEDHR